MMYQLPYQIYTDSRQNQNICDTIFLQTAKFAHDS